MAKGATVAKANGRRVADVSEAVGGVAERRKAPLWASISSGYWSAPAAATATVGGNGVTVCLPRSTSSGGIISDEPLESLVANLAARSMGRRGVKPGANVSGMRSLSVSCAAEVEDDYLWETDPNGCWLASFP